MTIIKKIYNRKTSLLKVFLLLFLLTSTNILFAQDKGIMASEGKIYVVMSVVVVILVGLFLYLISLDRKIRNIEKKN